MSLLFFSLAVLACLFTLNVYRPLFKQRQSMLLCFFSGWLYGDLAPWIIILQLLLTAFFVAAGAVTGALGAISLVLAASSWAFLAAHYASGMGLKAWCEQPLEHKLGQDYQSFIPPELRAGIPEDFPSQRYLRPFHPARADVTCIKDVVVASVDGWDIKVDIYHHQNLPQDAPVLFQIHGGGWVEPGDKSRQALPLMNHLAAQGWVCVTVNYRLSPKHIWPAHIVDCKRALAWTKKHVHKYGGNPDFIVATGGSAGGHLCSLLALSPNDPEFQPGFENENTEVSACVTFYGVYDFCNESDLHINDGTQFLLEKVVFKKTLAEHRELFRMASPMHRIHADAPPFFIIHGRNDVMTSLPEAQLFVERMQTVSKEKVVFLEVPGAHHAFDIIATPRADWTMRAVMLYVNYEYGRYLNYRKSAESK